MTSIKPVNNELNDLIKTHLYRTIVNQISEKYDSKYRAGGTIASVLFLLSQGVQIFRVHEVKEIKQAILVFKKIINE